MVYYYFNNLFEFLICDWVYEIYFFNFYFMFLVENGRIIIILRLVYIREYKKWRWIGKFLDSV